jgi:dTDP-4-dehydrorhamnose reductase
VKILLTGASGQVGSRLRPLLGTLGEVWAPGRADFDLAAPETLAAPLRAFRPDLVVNPAAYTAVDKAEDEEALATRINAEAVGVLADEARRAGAALVHFSTDYVFDGAGAAPWREDAQTAPLGAYGRSKLAGEGAVLRSGAAALVLRTSWVYDAQGTNFLDTMLRLGAEREELRVVADQFGAPTSAEAIADGVLRILRAAMPDIAGTLRAKGGIVHLCCRGEVSWHGFAEAIFAGARRRGASLAVKRVHPIGTSEYPTKARRPANSRLALARLAERFGVEPPTWQEALEAVLDQKFGRARGAQS